MEKLLTLDELEKLIKLNAEDCKKTLIDFVNKYKKENKRKKAKAFSLNKHFKSLGLNDKDLNSIVEDSPHCYQLVFGKENSFSKNDEWYMTWDVNIDISWDAKTLLDVLKEIEKNSKKKIVKFGFSSYSDYTDEEGKIAFYEIEEDETLNLSECDDTFNLQLSDGSYYHLFFCEAK